jgi:hypothetical protein
VIGWQLYNKLQTCINAWFIHWSFYHMPICCTIVEIFVWLSSNASHLNIFWCRRSEQEKVMKLLFDADEDFCCIGQAHLRVISWVPTIRSSPLLQQFQNKFLHYKTTEVKCMEKNKFCKLSDSMSILLC